MTSRLISIAVVVVLSTPLACGTVRRDSGEPTDLRDISKLTQRNPDQSDIAPGGLSKGIEVRLGASTIWGSLNECDIELTLEVELRPTADQFAFQPTHTSSVLKRKLGEHGTEVALPTVSENLLRAATLYKWIARQRMRYYTAVVTGPPACSNAPPTVKCEDPKDRYSQWVHYVPDGQTAFRTPFHQGKNTPLGVLIETGQLQGGTFQSLSADDTTYYEVASTGAAPQRVAWVGVFRDLTTTMTDLTITYKGNNSIACTQNLDILRWSDNTWVNLDRRDVGATDMQVTAVAPVPNRQFLNNDADLHVRVWCESASPVQSRGNHMLVTYNHTARQ